MSIEVAAECMKFKDNHVLCLLNSLKQHSLFFSFSFIFVIHVLIHLNIIWFIFTCLFNSCPQDKPAALQALLSGEVILSSSIEFHRQGNRDRALVMLHQMIDDAHQGKRQFLTGNPFDCYTVLFS